MVGRCRASTKWRTKDIDFIDISKGSFNNYFLHDLKLTKIQNYNEKIFNLHIWAFADCNGVHFNKVFRKRP